MGPVTSILIFFAVFPKMHHPISTLPVILSFLKLFVAQTSRTSFFLLLLKRWISPPFINQSSKFLQWIYMWYLSMYKLCVKENLIQLSGEPRGQHLGEFQQRMLILIYIWYELFVYHLNPGMIQYNIILFDSFVSLGSGFKNLNYLEMKKNLISNFWLP